MLCYFCGEISAIVSMSDQPGDTGRVEVYCGNSDCEAREIVVLVLKDGTRQTAERSDVRVLRMIDDPRRRGVRPRALPADYTAPLGPENSDVVARRWSAGPLGALPAVGSDLDD
ncbi:hypothetical protein [Saccharothrix obliqua]|uniref:hypothetical protein n=1 Tax=Saccharothrix obliqua TaxID=2861747 RepID=UPI001C5CE22E|nr:hypothetical protein [Saccharothrix obliqua]MBW4722428.1 hypothetical protein [Saccharothrix obliqua]